MTCCCRRWRRNWSNCRSPVILAAGTPYEREFQLLADAPGSIWLDFPMPGNGRAPTRHRIFPNGMVASFSEKPATMLAEMTQKFAASHEELSAATTSILDVACIKR